MKTITYDETQWKLVPIKLTEMMDRAADDAETTEEAWRKLLDNAPQPPEYAVPRSEREALWFALVMGAAAAIEDAVAGMRDTDAKRIAQNAATHYRERAQKVWITFATPRPQPPAIRSTRVELTEEQRAGLTVKGEVEIPGPGIEGFVSSGAVDRFIKPLTVEECYERFPHLREDSLNPIKEQP